jgi:hypothetical protein
MKRCVLLVIAAGMIALAAGHADAAGPFDGEWSGEDPANAQCDSGVKIVLLVGDNAIKGYVQGSRGTGAINSGAVSSDGKAHIKYGGSKLSFEADVQFSANKFDTDVSSACGGTRHVTGTKGQ